MPIEKEKKRVTNGLRPRAFALQLPSQSFVVRLYCHASVKPNKLPFSLPYNVTTTYTFPLVTLTYNPY